MRTQQHLPGKFAEWLAKGEPGTAFVYHVGHLASERTWPTVEEMARMAWQAHVSGRVTLAQRRQAGPLAQMEYRAIKAPTENR